MRGALQQGQDGRINNAPCCRKNKNTHGNPLPRDRLAVEQEIWTRGRRLQAFNNVRFLPPNTSGTHLNVDGT